MGDDQKIVQELPEFAARQCAADVLHAVFEQQMSVDKALVQNPLWPKLTPQDRAFAHSMVLAVLRERGLIDAMLNACLKSPLKQKYGWVMQCLRIGVAQLAYLDVPPHAAVHSTVELVKKSRFTSHKNLLNAVLNRIAKEHAALRKRLDVPKLHLPVWLYDALKTHYGKEATNAIIAQHRHRAPLDLTIKSDAAQWAKRLGGVALFGNTLRLGEVADVTQLAGYDEGEWWVQDVAASVPVQLLGDVQGLRALDVGAAPGGKTAQLAARGAQVTALDRSPKRMRRLLENMQRLHMQVECISDDARNWQPKQPFDVIVLDAPCSATGTLRRNPDIAWTRKPKDVPPLVGLQKEMLEAAAQWLKPGGKLVYTVCSLLPEEGEQQVERFLDEHSAFALVDVPETMPAQWHTADGMVRLLPHFESVKGGMDGFFAACLQRTA